MRRRAPVLLVACAAAPVVAQGTGSRVGDHSAAVANTEWQGSAGSRTTPIKAAPRSSADREASDARRIAFDYGRCVVKKRHDRAAEAILADEDNHAILTRYTDLVDGDCLGQVAGSVQARFSGDLYRYALADALVNADYMASGPTSFSDRLPLSHLLPPDQARLDAALATTKNHSRQDKLKSDFAEDLTSSWLSRYGECVVRQDPVDARLWLLTPPAIPEETSRINSLRPAFSACLDGTTTFNRVSMRGAVAINYYRLARATPMPPAGKTN